MIKPKVDRGMLLSTLDQGVVSGTNFIFGLLIARRLGPELFGIFGLTFVGWLLVQGMGRALVTQPFLIRHGKATYAATVPGGWGAYALGFGALVSVLSVIVAGILTVFSGWRFGGPFFALAAALPFLFLQDFGRLTLIRQGRFNQALASDALVGTAQVAGVAIYLAFGSSVTIVMLLFGLGGAIGLIWMLRSTGLRLRLSTHFLDTVGDARAAGSPWLAGQFGIYWLYSYSIVAIVAGVLTPAAAGGLRSAQLLFGFVPVMVLGFENFALPHFASEWVLHRGRGVARELKRLGAPLVAVMAGCTIGAGILGPRLLTPVFGARYSAYGSLLIILAVQYVLVAASTPLIVALKASGKVRWTFSARLSSLATLASTLPILLRARGLEGAAWAVAIAEAVSMFIVTVGVSLVVRDATVADVDQERIREHSGELDMPSSLA